MLFRMLLASIAVLAFTWLTGPHFSAAILARAQARHQPHLDMSVTFRGGSLHANGWFSGPVMACAESSNPEAVITYSLNGGPQVRARQVLLSEPGRYAITWNACKDTLCHDPFTQNIKIAAIDSDRLSYSPGLRRWSFAGTVTEIRPVHLLGMPAEVAKVQSSGYHAWVILRIDTGTYEMGEISLGKARIGERVRVSISGAHVLPGRVDWNACQPAASPVCRFGKLYDDGPLSLDWNIPVSPSNQFIHAGRPNLHWGSSLFWYTDKIDTGEGEAPAKPDQPPNPRIPRKDWLPGCLALGPAGLAGTHIPDAAACPAFRASTSIAWCFAEPHPPGNLCLAGRTPPAAGPGRLPPGVAGNLMPGHMDRRLLPLFE